MNTPGPGPDLRPLVPAAADLACRARCGTYAGVMAHRNAHEQLCPPCRTANATYVREWRQRHPGANARHCRTARQRRRWRTTEAA
jgi:hypothetical protein